MYSHDSVLYESNHCCLVCCRVLQSVAVCCRVLQCVVVYCGVLQCTWGNTQECDRSRYSPYSRQPEMQHTATHCNTLPHTATHCNTPAIYCNTPGNTPGRDRGRHSPRARQPEQHPRWLPWHSMRVFLSWRMSWYSRDVIGWCWFTRG